MSDNLDSKETKEPNPQEKNLSLAEERMLLYEKQRTREKEEKEHRERRFEEMLAESQKKLQEENELKDIERKQQEERRIQEAKKWREVLTQKKKEWEEQRIEKIISHRNEWGDWMCQQFVIHMIDPYSENSLEIMSKLTEWGQDNCLNLLTQIITIGMTSEMVKLALGEPTSIDEKVITEKQTKYRWIYGTPRQGATYVWFKNDIVTRIKR